MENNGLALAHETPTRLRFKLPILKDQRIDFAYLQILLESERGVTSVRINRRAGSVAFDYNGSTESHKAIHARMLALSREGVPPGASEPRTVAELAPMMTTAAAIVLLPFLQPRARLALTLAATSRTLLEGLDTLLMRGVKMEVLDAIAVGLTTSKGEYYTANITNFLLKLGEYLEGKAEQQSDRLLRQLLRPKPTPAWVEREGQLQCIPGHEVHTGDHVVVGAGERIPVDGLVLSGAALVNQSSLTGEAELVPKETMDRVISGTVIEDGRLKIEARHVGEETTTARISRFIEDSLSKRSQIQRLADRLADQRVYLTLGTGALVYLLTGDERRLESVFLVDYSCAIKLGTPVAFKSGMYNAASSGILLKGGQVIEQLAGVDTFVFDKTGTLTHSELQVTDVEVFNPEVWPRDRLLAMTASIEEHASHPVAEAIVRKAKAKKLNHIDHGEAEYLVAHGMSCPVNEDRLLIGSRHYLEEHEGVSFANCEATIERLHSQGKTLLYVGTDKEPLGIIGLRDKERSDAGQSLARLREAGVQHIVMLTGDQYSKAKALADDLKIDTVHAEMIPEDKAGIIMALQAEGRKVAFVGDGVNDGPALVQADVGIAMPRGAELARAAADVVLLEDKLEALTAAYEISQRTMRMIETNFKLAVWINTGVLVGAAAGWLSPIAAAFLHNGTTVGILMNALRGARASAGPKLI